MPGPLATNRTWERLPTAARLTLKANRSTLRAPAGTLALRHVLPLTASSLGLGFAQTRAVGVRAARVAQHDPEGDLAPALGDGLGLGLHAEPEPGAPGGSPSGS